MTRLPALALMLSTSGCVSISHPAPVAGVPTFDPVAFFAGRTRGIGMLKVAFHHTDRTRVEGFGHLEGAETIVLDQIVRRGDRASTRRRWRLTRTGVGRYAGTLSDAAGPATGDVRGNCLHLSFRMKGGLVAQQWLVLRPGGQVAENVMVVTKQRIPVARLDETIV